MTIASMTGFARAEGGDDRLRWVWEARSVNGKSLDLRLRLPNGWEMFDPLVRKAAQARFKRGNIAINLEVKGAQDRGALQINEPLLNALIGRCADAGQDGRIDTLLTVRGVVEAASDSDAPDQTPDAERIAAMQSDLNDAIDRLAEMRGEEGGRIASVLRDHLGEIETLVEAAQTCADAAPAAIRGRLEQQITELLENNTQVSPDRLAQEAAMLAVKADVREELDRLSAHIDAARDLLREGDEKGGAIGRRFDFLCQEFNREANTIASKSTALELTRIGLDLKASIDRLREQVQNIE
ncbi:MAG: YicC/YloC family endoribonuclease [Alphaproteobacteria bacterium]